MKQEDDLHLALEQLVRRHAGKSAPELAGLLYEDYHARVNEGDRPDRDVYLNSAPVLRDLLSRFFDVHDALGDESLADEIAQLTVDPVHDANEPSQVMLGDFRIVREISRSVMGTVYEAEQVSLQRKVALKTLHRLFGLDSGRRRRFLIETQLAATLQIDGIVPVLSAGEQEGICYYTMPFIEGHTLSAVFLKKDLVTPEETADRNGNHRSQSNLLSDPKQIAMLLVGVSRALHAAHEQGIVHRDIKPSNILIDQNHKAWLSDFGLARSPDAETLTKTGDLLGTYYYMSPEQVTGSAAKVDRRSDVYSLGATLYETIAGQPPFADQKPPRLIRSIIESDPTALRKIQPEVPRPLDAIIRKAMSKSPTDRYDTSAEFADDLERYVGDEPVLADAGVWTEGRRWWRQHQRTMLIMAVTLATAVLGLFFGMQTRLTQLRKLNHDLVRSEEQSANLRYANHMQLAYHAMQARNFPRAKELVERHGQPNSGFEHQLLANHLRQYTPDLVLRGHRKIVQDLAFAPSTQQLISTSEDQTICFWNLTSGELVERIEVDDVVSAVAISPDGQSIGLGIGDRAELWDLLERQPIRVVANHKAGVESIAFSPDGALIARGTRYDSIHVSTLEGVSWLRSILDRGLSSWNSRGMARHSTVANVLNLVLSRWME